MTNMTYRASVKAPLHLSFEFSFEAIDPFLDHWADRYDQVEQDEKLYDPFIGRVDLRSDLKALETLFQWKNGTPISQGKLASIRSNYFDCWTEDADLESRFLAPSKGGGPIWNIFYLHCRAPDRYPIFDQHAHRAMIYMQERVICGALTDKPKGCIYEAYKNRYVPFFQQVGRDQRTIDRALFSFGQFLKHAKRFWSPGPIAPMGPSKVIS